MCKTIEITEKRCSKCGEVKPVEEFNKDKKNKCGLNSWCKECQRLLNAQWRKANPEKYKEACQKWRKENPERTKKYDVVYYEKNKVKTKERYFKYYRKNIDEIKPKRKAYRDRMVKSLSDVYVKKIIKTQFGLTAAEIDAHPTNLVELKRTQLFMKRVKNKSNQFINQNS